MKKNTKAESSESLALTALLGATATIKILADELENFSAGFGDPAPKSVNDARELVKVLTRFIEGMPK